MATPIRVFAGLLIPLPSTLSRGGEPEGRFAPFPFVLYNRRTLPAYAGVWRAGFAGGAGYGFSQMLLTIDIGNTVVTLGVFDSDRLLATFRLSTNSRRLADEYGLQLVSLLNLRGIDPAQITAACMCSGVPPLTVVFAELCRTYFNVAP